MLLLLSISHKAHILGGLERYFVFSHRYIPEELDIEAEFTQLISGVIWLVRNGKNYVDVSQETECSDSQETGTYAVFVVF